MLIFFKSYLFLHISTVKTGNKELGLKNKTGNENRIAVDERNMSCRDDRQNIVCISVRQTQSMKEQGNMERWKKDKGM